MGKIKPKLSNQTPACVAIIPAAGRPSNRILSNSILPDAMIPINGKPVIGYILEDLLERGIYKAVLVLNINDRHTEKYVANKFGEKLNLKVVYPTQDRGVGYSIFSAGKFITDQEGVLVYLGDTIYKGKLDFKKDFLVTSMHFEDPKKWCFAEQSGRGLRFINKPEVYKGRGQILSGLYYFKSGKLFKSAVLKTEKKFKKIEISDILNAYQKYSHFKLVKAEKWYDCGNIENYYSAKVDFLKIRSFNRLSYNPLLGIITKSGKHNEKINQEINWYLNLPDELKIFAPRLFDYQISKEHSQYSLEYYGYQSLADIFMYSYIDVNLWKSIIDRLLEITGLFEKYPAKLPFSFYSEMYLGKTHARLKQLEKLPYWSELFKQEKIIINDESFKNVPDVLKKLPLLVKKLYRKQDMSVIHGDLFLGNILYDIDSRLVKLIDPRGYFGKLSVYGDIKYDLAKLRHSFHGNYDFIVSDLFKLEESQSGNFNFKVYTEDSHQQIAKMFDHILERKGYNLEQVKFIEGLIFLSIIPLHSNSLLRQKAMFVTAIKLLNEAIK